MLINCPKCGFSQPEDKYCARCGIDVDAYKPSRDPWFSRFFRSLFGQLVILAFVFGAGAAYYIKIKAARDKDLFANSNNLENSSKRRAPTQIVSPTGAASSPNNSAAGAVNGDANPAADGNSPNGSGANATNLGEGQNPAATGAPLDPTLNPMAPNNAAGGGADPTLAGTVGAEAAGKDGEAGSGASLTGGNSRPHSAKIYWVEIKDEHMEKLIRESRSRNPVQNFGNYRAGVISDSDKVFQTTNSNLKTFLKENKSFEIAKSQQWFLGKRGQTTDLDLGFEVYVELLDAEGSYKGNLLITKSWKPDSAEVRAPANERSSYPANFEFKPKEAFFMSNILSRNVALDDEGHMTVSRISPFEVLRSADFQGSVSDLVMFLSFDN